MVAASRREQGFLGADELFEFELKSLARMLSVRWPTSLALWQGAIASAKNRANGAASLNAHVWFEALSPRADTSAEVRHHIDLGAQIVLGKSAKVTYFFAIGEKDINEQRSLLRKVHFDIDELVNPQERKPAVHLQLAGGPSPPLLARGYADAAFSHLLPEMEKPRVACLPQSFALLAHMALLEYHCTDEKIRAFIESDDWLAVVADAERTVWKPYFDHGSQWLGSTANRDLSLLSRYYGLPSLHDM